MEYWCSKCFKSFRSQNPAVVEDKPVCWDCAPITVMGDRRKLSWKDVLHAESFTVKDMYALRDLAEQLGYPFFLWNDQIFRAEKCINIGLTIDDVA